MGWRGRGCWLDLGDGGGFGGGGGGEIVHNYEVGWYDFRWEVWLVLCSCLMVMTPMNTLKNNVVVCQVDFDTCIIGASIVRLHPLDGKHNDWP